MKLVIGLGNPGRKYERTRHNVGFDVVDEIARLHQLPVPREKFRSLTQDLSVDGQRVMLLKPLTYMNLSGAAVFGSQGFLPRARSGPIGRL